MKTLIFEPAGCVTTGPDNLNCRIRTAFKNDEGKAFYLEVSASAVPSAQIKKLHPDAVWPWLYVMSFHEIDLENMEFDDFSKCRVRYELAPYKHKYTKKEILRLVNRHCGTSFEDVISPEMSGYRALDGSVANKGYNFSTEFDYDPEFSEKAVRKAAELKEHFKELFHQKYDNTSYWVEDATGKKRLMVSINVRERDRIAAGYPEREFAVAV